MNISRKNKIILLKTFAAIVDKCVALNWLSVSESIHLATNIARWIKELELN